MRTLPLLLAVFALSFPSGGGGHAATGNDSSPPEADSVGGVIRVTASYPGANARAVAEVIAAPIEQQVNGVEGMTGIESESRDGGSYTLTVRFRPKTDLDITRVLVQNRVALALPMLPDECQREGLSVKKVPDGLPVYWVAVTSPDGAHDGVYLANLARVFLKDTLVRVPGVSDLRVIGADEPVLRVWLDPDKLAARGWTAAVVARVIETPDIQVKRGYAEIPPKGQPFLYTVTTRERLVSADVFGRFILKATSEGKITRLKDVARIELGSDRGMFAGVNGKPAALVAVSASREKVTADQIRKTVGGIANLPEGVRVELVADFSAGNVVLVSLLLPDAASRERTRESAAKAAKLLREMPGNPGCVAFGDDHMPNVATILMTQPEKNRRAVAAIHEVLLRGVPDAACRVSGVPSGGQPFPVRVAVCETGDAGGNGLRAATDVVVKRLAKDAAATGVAVFPDSSVPKLEITLDNAKLKAIGVRASDVAAAIGTLTGNDVGGSYLDSARSSVMLIDPGPRPDDLAALKVRSETGRMVPLNTIVQIRRVEAPVVVTRVNLHPALILTANPPDGMTPAAAAARCVKSAEAVLPKGYRAVNLTRPGR